MWEDVFDDLISVHHSRCCNFQVQNQLLQQVENLVLGKRRYVITEALLSNLSSFQRELCYRLLLWWCLILGVLLEASSIYGPFSRQAKLRPLEPMFYRGLLPPEILCFMGRPTHLQYRWRSQHQCMDAVITSICRDKQILADVLRREIAGGISWQCMKRVR